MSEARINPAASLPINLPKPAKTQGTVAGESMDPNMPLAPLNSNGKPSFNQMLAKSNGHPSSTMVASEHDGSAKGDALSLEEVGALDLSPALESELGETVLGTTIQPDLEDEVLSQDSGVRAVADIEAQKAWIEGTTQDRQILDTESGVSVDVADIELSANPLAAPFQGAGAPTESGDASSVIRTALSEPTEQAERLTEVGDQLTKVSGDEKRVSSLGPESDQGEQGVGAAKDFVDVTNRVSGVQENRAQNDAGDILGREAVLTAETQVPEKASRTDAQTEVSDTVGETLVDPSNKAEVAQGASTQLPNTQGNQEVNAAAMPRGRSGVNLNRETVTNRAAVSEVVSATKAESTAKEAASQQVQAAKEVALQQSQASNEVKAGDDLPLRQKMGLDRMKQDRWGRALGQRALLMAQTGPNRMDIQLDPPELGLVQIRVSAGAAGEPISIQFQAANPAVRDALELHQQRLREMLSEQGVNMSFARSESEDSSQEDAEGRRGAPRDPWSGESNTVTTEVSAPVGLVDFYL